MHHSVPYVPYSFDHFLGSTKWTKISSYIALVIIYRCVHATTAYLFPTATTFHIMLVPYLKLAAEESFWDNLPIDHWLKSKPFVNVISLFNLGISISTCRAWIVLLCVQSPRRCTGKGETIDARSHKVKASKKKDNTALAPSRKRRHSLALAQRRVKSRVRSTNINLVCVIVICQHPNN